MLCIDELSELLEQCTGDSWGRCSVKPVVHNHERAQVFRWVHLTSGLGFVMVLSDRAEPMDGESVRIQINFFRQWGGRNLGLLYLLPSGIEKGAEHALPYYGYLRTAIVDYPNERLHFGTDSSRFQLLISAFADILGIPAGGKAKGEVFIRQCNSFGPREWTRNQLQRYAQENLLEWHPLYLSAIFSDLILTLDGHLHFEDMVILLFPQSIPVCSFALHEASMRYPDKKILVVYAHSCTKETRFVAQKRDIEHVHTKNPISVFIERGLAYIPLRDEVLFWHPNIWYAYLRVISAVSKYRVIGNAILVDDKVMYLSALSMADLLQVKPHIPNDCILVLHTQFSVDDTFFHDVSQYVWLYREELKRSVTIPIGIERAFLHFHAYSIQRNKQPRWQEHFFEREGRFFDRSFGYEVQLFEDISSEHPWLMLGFMFSMHTHTIPFLLYDKEQQILVVANPPKKETREKDAGIVHLEESMKRMGIPDEEFGQTYDIHGQTVMALVED